VKISIVTISYNQAQFLEQAILSVLNQEDADIEYIVVDPGSTDGSLEIIERYRSQLSKIILEPDAGPADGLNKGFADATGDLFGFVNSDDILLPGALKKISDAFIAHPGADVISGHALIIDEHGKEIRKCYSEPFSLLGHAYGSTILMQPSTFFRSASFENTGGFNVSNRSNWDGELFVGMAMQGARFELIDRFLSGYRLQPESITSSGKMHQSIQDYQRHIFIKILGRIPDWRDPFIGNVLRLFKHIRSPRALYERISKGPIYRRHAKK